MSTNYYVKCACCGHERHIGKAAFKYVSFTFRGYNNGEDEMPKIKNIDDWKDFLLSQKIINEYGESITYKHFWDIVRGCENQRWLYGEFS